MLHACIWCVELEVDVFHIIGVGVHDSLCVVVRVEGPGLLRHRINGCQQAEPLVRPDYQSSQRTVVRWC